MAAIALDVVYLSTYLSLPTSTLSSTVDRPTKELVVSILHAVQTRAKEHDDLKATKLRLDVELESAVLAGNAKTRVVKANLAKALGENGALKEKLGREGEYMHIPTARPLAADELVETAHGKLETELQSLKSSLAGSTAELDSLRSRITSLETSNRSTISLLDAKTTAYDQLSKELSSQHQKVTALRQELANRQQAERAAQSSLATAKLRLSNLEQEIENLKENNVWLNQELSAKSADTSKLRKEKNAKIAELQRQFEESTASTESLRKIEASLRARLDDLEQKTEQSFATIQQLRESAANDQESFRRELKGTQRLAELFETSAKTARERLQDLQSSLDQANDDAAEEIGRARTTVEMERAEKESAERRVAELEVLVERLENDLSSVSQIEGLKGTPRRRMNGSLGPNREPMSSPGAGPKAGLNFTQMYSDYTTAKSQLDAERRRNEKLSATMDEMIQDLESKQPEIEDLQREHGRLQSEMAEMTSLLEASHAERDHARREARKLGGQTKAQQHEGELLRQQLRDLSMQIRILLTEIQARDEGLSALDPSQQAQLMQATRSMIEDESSNNLTDTGRVISQRLTIFRNVQQLQEQNVNLLRVTRELGEQMEGEEALKKQRQHAQAMAELRDLQVQMEQCKDEMRSMATRSESYLRERDMFRRMLHHRGQLPVDANAESTFGQSVNSATSAASPGGTRQPEPSANAQDATDMKKLIKEMQSHFDAYREEAATDHRALKEQAERLSREKGEMQVELTKVKSQVSIARERFEMLQANYHLLQSENAELQKRANLLGETSIRQDLKTQQVAEDLVESRSLVESMLKEVANLKAEKDLWKRIEARMGEDNERLRNEMSRLNELMTSRENLLNERDISESENRRRLQIQLEKTENELQATKRRLNEETDELKKASMRREYDGQQHQKVVDDLRAGLSQAKEGLAVAQTSRDHLQIRVDELTTELKATEEHVQALRRGQAKRHHNGEASTERDESDVDPNQEASVNREQEMSAEISELKHELELAQTQLRETRGQVEQYKAISQSSEEELQSLNDTYEQYRHEVDQLITEKDAKIQSLTERIEELLKDISDTGSELSGLRAELHEKAAQAQQEKVTVQLDITKLKDENERLDAAATLYQQDLRTQAEIAQQAQQNYENELLKHAEAAKSLQDLRTEHNQLRTDVVQLRSDAEAGRAALTQNETIWEETRQRYEGELREMQSRREEVSKQNDLLHKQLEAVSKEIEALRQSRSTDQNGPGDIESASDSSTTDRSIGQLREVITFLRRDKEIVDVQYEMSVQEIGRIKQQLEYTQSQLDETRLKLDQERHSQSESGRTLITHNELLEKINELNLYRESAVTLRNETRQAQAQLAEKAQQVKGLIEEIQPLKATIQELQIDGEAREGELKLLQEDRDRWQQRTQNILQKYDTVDPAELEALKQQLSTLEMEKAQLLADNEPLRQQIDSIPEQIRQAQEDAVAPWRDRQEKQVAQFKERSRVLVAARNEKVLELQTVMQGKEESEQQLAESRQETKAALTERDEARARADSLSAQLNNAADVAQKPADDPESTSTHMPLSQAERQQLEERAVAAEAQASEYEKRVRDLQGDLESYRSRVAALEQEVEQLERKLEEAAAQIAGLQSARQATAESTGSDSRVDVEALRDELMKAQQKVDSLLSQAAVRAAVDGSVAGDDSKSVAQQISEQVDAIRLELDQRHAERVNMAEEQFKLRADKMKTQLTKRLTDGKDQIRQTLQAEHQKALEQLKKQHEEEIQRLHARHQEELDQLRQESASQLEQERQKQAAEGNRTQAGDQAAGTQRSENDGPVGEASLSESQLRELARTNPIIQTILRNNISTQIKKAREEQEKIAEAKLNETVAKADKEKEQAVIMEAQRQKVKLSMADGKVRTFSARLEVVQKAASDTPQRPVVDVWEVAKVAKAAPVAAPAPAGQAAQAAPVPQPNKSGSNPNELTSQVAPTISPLTPQSHPNPLAPLDTQQAQPTGSGALQPPQQNPFTQAHRPAQPTTLQTSPQAENNPFLGELVPQGQQQLFTQGTQPNITTSSVPEDAGNIQQPQTAEARRGVSSLPRKPTANQAAANVGTGPSALRGLLGQGQSMLPRMPGAGRAGFSANQLPALPNVTPAAQSPTHAQSPNQRQHGPGRVRGRGRGNQGQRKASADVPFGQSNSPAPRPEEQGSDARTNLNANARQFIPGAGGNKRSRDDGAGDGTGSGRGGKRVRGAGSGVN